MTENDTRNVGVVQSGLYLAAEQPVREVSYSSNRYWCQCAVPGNVTQCKIGEGLVSGIQEPLTIPDHLTPF
jgi:hypothetical protein